MALVALAGCYVRESAVHDLHDADGVVERNGGDDGNGIDDLAVDSLDRTLVDLLLCQ